MSSLLAKILGNQLAHKLVHQWRVFMHKRGSAQIVYGGPSFLIGFGVGRYMSTAFEHMDKAGETSIVLGRPPEPTEVKQEPPAVKQEPPEVIQEPPGPPEPPAPPEPTEVKHGPTD